MKRSLNSEDIRCVLPHRGRMLLLEGAEIEPGGSLGRARIRIGRESVEPSWCAGLTCPHLYLAEALAQLAGVTLAWLSVDGPVRGVLGVLVEFPELRFQGRPGPGDDIDLEARLDLAFGSLVRFRVRARCGPEEIVAGSLTIAIDEMPAVSP